MTTWLVTGAAGQVGTHVVAQLRAAGADVVAVTRAELDITSPDAVVAAIAAHHPDVVINTAAYTAVDAAEADEAAAALVNATGPRLLAEALARTGGRLVQISTDYVFDGRVFDGRVIAGGATQPGATQPDATQPDAIKPDAIKPYDIDDPVGPATAYGRTKLAGEQAVLAALPERGHVVRTAWVHGGPGPNFVDTMRRLEGERDTVDVVADQIGSPTAAPDLAGALIALGQAAALGGVPGGVLHFVNSGQASWCDLARETFRLAGADPARVRAVDSAAFTRPAPRPAWSVLSTRSWTEAGLPAPRPWQDALAASLFDR